VQAGKSDTLLLPSRANPFAILNSRTPSESTCELICWCKEESTHPLIVFLGLASCANFFGSWPRRYLFIAHRIYLSQPPSACMPGIWTHEVSAYLRSRTGSSALRRSKPPSCQNLAQSISVIFSSALRPMATKKSCGVLMVPIYGLT
jgi:hypothetical protein